jgi:hypothetical protein
MDNNLLIALAVVGAALAAMLVVLTVDLDPLADLANTPTFAVASSSDLRIYPTVLSTSTSPAQGTVSVRLPDNELSVLLRPLTQAEVDAANTQAIAIQLIEWQLISDALVMPRLDPVEVADLSDELLLFLKAKVNEISGFGAFELE